VNCTGGGAGASATVWLGSGGDQMHAVSRRTPIGRVPEFDGEERLAGGGVVARAHGSLVVGNRLGDPAQRNPDGLAQLPLQFVNGQ
jgi:hypothetical protein